MYQISDLYRNWFVLEVRHNVTNKQTNVRANMKNDLVTTSGHGVLTVPIFKHFDRVGLIKPQTLQFFFKKS